MTKPRLMVLGYKRHGKDTVCEILHKRFGLTFESSSHFVAERAVRPWLAERGITYASLDEMYADRVNHRPGWYDAIRAYNTPDNTRLGRALYDAYDIYCGIRSKEELDALKAAGVVQYTFWVDRSKHLPPEDKDSMTVTIDDADYVIDNNGTLTELDIGIAVAYATALARVFGPEMALAA